MLFLVVSVNCFQENCYLALMEYSHSWDVTVTSGDVKESSSRVLIIHKYKCIRYMHIFLTDSVRPWTNVLQLALRPLFLLGSLFCQPSPQGPSGEKGPIGLSLGIRGRRSPTRRGWFSRASGTWAPWESMSGALRVLERRALPRALWLTWRGKEERGASAPSTFGCLRTSTCAGSGWLFLERVLCRVFGAWHLCIKRVFVFGKTHRSGRSCLEASSGLSLRIAVNLPWPALTYKYKHVNKLRLGPY